MTRIRPGRSETKLRPSGAKSIAHGVSSPRAMTLVPTTGVPDGAGTVVGDAGAAVGAVVGAAAGAVVGARVGAVVGTAPGAAAGPQPMRAARRRSLSLTPPSLARPVPYFLMSAATSSSIAALTATIASVTAWRTLPPLLKTGATALLKTLIGR